MQIQTQAYQKEKKPQNGDVQKSANNHERLKDELRRLLAELLGTFALTLVAAGGDVIATISGGAISPAARVVAPGLLVMAMIYTLGSQSGAHFNPVVTLAFTLRRDFPSFPGAVCRATGVHSWSAQCSLLSSYACFLAWLDTWERLSHTMEQYEHLLWKSC
jgi:glycerol uptake facilitator-like aquaporin